MDVKSFITLGPGQHRQGALFQFQCRHSKIQQKEGHYW